MTALGALSLWISVSLALWVLWTALSLFFDARARRRRLVALCARLAAEWPTWEWPR